MLADPPPTDGSGVALSLLDGFHLRRDGLPVRLPPAVQRVVALVALHQDPLTRRRVAGSMWPGASEAHADGSLRSALWRLRKVGVAVVHADEQRLALAAHVRVDVRDRRRLVRQLLDGRAGVEDGEHLTSGPFSGELLPGWEDDWVLAERAGLEEARVQGLEALSARRLSEGRIGAAIAAALAAARADPLRESAHRAVVRAYIQDGNHVRALEHYRAFVRRLQEEAGLWPSAQLRELVDAVVDRAPRDTSLTAR